MTFCAHGVLSTQAGDTVQNITTGGTFEKLTAFTTAGASNGVTVSVAGDNMTLTKTGIYLVTFQASFSGTISSEVIFRAKWNDVDQEGLKCVRKLGTGGDIGSCSFVGLLDCTVANQALEIWATTDGDGDGITVEEAQLSVVWLSTT